MTIVDFTKDHIEQAHKIVLRNYEEEQKHVPALPVIGKAIDLAYFAENGLGVAAFDGGIMRGFLCSVEPFPNAFAGSTNVKGVFSPLGANGAAGGEFAKTYARMYQAAGEKWAKAGAASHAVCLFSHEKKAHGQFFRYGFGMRCIDTVRGMDEIDAPPCPGYDFTELAPKDILDILPLDHMLNDSYLDSPFFMFREKSGADELVQEYEQNKSIYFIARHNDKAVAFIKAELDGETFIRHTPGYLHVNGLYCMTEHRGKGLPQTLLNMLVLKLKSQGYIRLGVDFESINPSGSAFWLKYFDAYSYSLVRRIDENSL